MYYLFYEGGSPTPAPISESQAVDTLQISATTAIQEEFTEDLRDPTSERFQEIERSICSEVGANNKVYFLQ